MRLIPQLAQHLDQTNVEPYLTDNRWWAEQKLDGHRRLINVEGDIVRAANRRGELISTEAHLIEAFGGISGEWIFDGEWLDNKFWLFDMPYAIGRITPETPRSQRRAALEAVHDAAWKGSETIRLLDVARTTVEKRALLQWGRDNSAEGIVLKLAEAPYRPGKRIPEMLKVKFTETADCFILEVGRQGKSSCSIGLLHNGVETEVGAIKMSDRDLAAAKQYDVVEVKYLYCTNDLRLYGPAVFLHFRTDKHASECNTDQLKFVNKSVRTSLP